MTSPLQFLVVEDDPGDVRLAMGVLKKLHLANRAVVVNDGEEAMEFLQKRGKYSQRSSGLPAFILLDLKLPRVNGFEVLQQLKSDALLKSIPVVVLTSSCQERDVNLAYEMGVNAYVVKSIDYTTYFATFRDLVLYWLDVNEPPSTPVTQCQASVAAPRSRRNETGFMSSSAWLRQWPDNCRTLLDYGSRVLFWRQLAT